MIDNIKRQVIDRMKAKGLNFSQLEAKIGVSKGAVINIMNGRSTNPGIKLMKLIADGLDCPVHSLIEQCIEYDRTTCINYRLLTVCFSTLCSCLIETKYKCDLKDFIYLLDKSYRILLNTNQNEYQEDHIRCLLSEILASNQSSISS